MKDTIVSIQYKYQRRSEHDKIDRLYELLNKTINQVYKFVEQTQYLITFNIYSLANYIYHNCTQSVVVVKDIHYIIN